MSASSSPAFNTIGNGIAGTAAGKAAPTECVQRDSKRGTHSRAVSTDSSASASTQCTQYTDPRRSISKPWVDWCEISSDEDSTVPRRSVAKVANNESQLVKHASSGSKINRNDAANERTRHSDAVNSHVHSGRSEQSAEPPRLCLAELLLDDQRYQRRLDESHLRALRLEGANTPNAYSDSDNEYYSLGILWVEKDAFKSQDDGDSAHPLFQPLTDFCLQRGASLKRFRSVPNLLRWLTKRRVGTRRAKRSYVCVCAQESVSALEAFFQTWENFVTVDKTPIIYSNQKAGENGEIEVSVPRQWARKSHFPTFAACLQDFPKENVVWVQEDEQNTDAIQQSLKGVKNVLRFKTILDSIEYFTSRVDNHFTSRVDKHSHPTANGKPWRRKHEKQHLRIWPTNEPKYTVLCKGRAVALESFFRSWKSSGADGPAERLITYGDISEDEDERVIHRIFQGEGGTPLASVLGDLLQEVDNSLSSMQDSMSVNYSQLSSEWSSLCGDRASMSEFGDRDWPSDPSHTPHNRESEPGSSRKRSSTASLPVDLSRTPSPVFHPRWRPSIAPNTPRIGCRLVVWRPQGLEPPRGIPAPSWADARSVAWTRQPIARPSRPTNSNSGPKQPVTLEPKRLSNDTKPKPLKSRPLQSPGLKSAQHVNPRNRLCTAPLQAPPFPLLAPIQEEQ